MGDYIINDKRIQNLTPVALAAATITAHVGPRVALRLWLLALSLRQRIICHKVEISFNKGVKVGKVASK